MSRVQGPSFRSLSTALTILFAGLTILAGATGCYRHVVRADGIGSTYDEIQEPNLEEEAVRSTNQSRPRSPSMYRR